MRRVRMRRSRFALHMRVGRDNDERTARVVQRGNTVVEETKRAMRAALMMVAVLRRRVVVRSARVMLAGRAAGRVPGMLLYRRNGRGVRQRQQPMP